MQFLKTTAKTTAVFLIILMTASITLTTIPATAQVIPGTIGGTPSTYEYSTTVPAGAQINFTFSPLAYLSVSPNPVGLGQFILVNLWMTEAPAAERQLQHFTVTFTKPSGKVDKVENLKSYEADGTAWFEYVVDEVGTWEAVFTFAGQYFPPGRYSNGVPNTVNNTGSLYQGMYYNPATTPKTYIVVQTDPVMSWYSPLPTDYWTRPISMNNREWNVIAGNFPWDRMQLSGSMNGRQSYFGPYISASKTAHVLWKRLDAFPTGIIGAETGNYGNKGNGNAPSVIFEGRCYDTMTMKWYNGSFLSCAVCYDLRTGEIYYMHPTAAPFYGMTPTWIEYNKGTGGSVEGGGETNTYTASLKLISGGSMYVINPSTGAISNNITLGGLTATLRHANWALMFQTNNSALFTGTTGSAIINWTTSGTTQNYTSRITSNVTNAEFRSLASGGVDPEAGTNIVQSRFTLGNVGGGRLRGYSLVTGKLMWDVNFTDSPFNPGTNCADQGKYFCVFENMMIRGIDAFTGRVLWETEAEYPWGDFWTYYVASGLGVFVADSYAGTYAFDWDTGEAVWLSSHLAPPYETPYNINGTAGTSTYPGTGTPIIVDGMVYVQANEHTPTAPYARGFGTYCINATTGELMWKLDEPCVLGAAADGYSIVTDQYSGYMYVLGKGKSQTTVSAGPKTIAKGNSLVIEGTVTDLSPGSLGAACVSEESMGAYMSYLHMQSQMQNMLHPDPVTGVPVSIDAMDPNGNFVHIADVTSEVSSFFSTTWKPDMVGKYVITASFAGSPSYGSSFAETAIVVDPAPAEIEFPPAVTPIDYSQTLNIILAAVVVAIILAIVAIALVLRKR